MPPGGAFGARWRATVVENISPKPTQKAIEASSCGSWSLQPTSLNRVPAGRLGEQSPFEDQASGNGGLTGTPGWPGRALCSMARSALSTRAGRAVLASGSGRW